MRRSPATAVRAPLPMEVVMMHLRKPAPLVGFPDQVARLVMRALEKTPDRRQQSADGCTAVRRVHRKPVHENGDAEHRTALGSRSGTGSGLPPMRVPQLGQGSMGAPPPMAPPPLMK